MPRIREPFDPARRLRELKGQYKSVMNKRNRKDELRIRAWLEKNMRNKLIRSPGELYPFTLIQELAKDVLGAEKLKMGLSALSPYERDQLLEAYSHESMIEDASQETAFRVLNRRSGRSHRRRGRDEEQIIKRYKTYTPDLYLELGKRKLPVVGDVKSGIITSQIVDELVRKYKNTVLVNSEGRFVMPEMIFLFAPNASGRMPARGIPGGNEELKTMRELKRYAIKEKVIIFDKAFFLNARKKEKAAPVYDLESMVATAEKELEIRPETHADIMGCEAQVLAERRKGTPFYEVQLGDVVLQSPETDSDGKQVTKYVIYDPVNGEVRSRFYRTNGPRPRFKIPFI